MPGPLASVDVTDEAGRPGVVDVYRADATDPGRDAVGRDDPAAARGGPPGGPAPRRRTADEQGSRAKPAGVARLTGRRSPPPGAMTALAKADDF